MSSQTPLTGTNPTDSAPIPIPEQDRQVRRGPMSLRDIDAKAWKVTLLSLGGWMLVNADGSLFNLNYPLLQDDLGISDQGIGNLYAAIYAIGAVATFFAGPVMDRWGRKPVYQLCLVAAIVGSLLTAGAGGFIVLLLARGITQAGATTEWMAGQVMVAEEAPAGARGRLIGIAQIGYPLGFFLGSLLSYLVVPHLGWRGLFLFGVLPIVMLVWARRSVHETERFTQTAAALAERPHRGLYRQLFAADLRRTTVFAALWHLVYAFGVAGLLSFLPSIYEHFGVDLTHTYLSSAIATGVAALGYLLCAFVGERIGRREAAVVWLVVGAGAGALLAFEGHNFWLLTTFYSLVYFFTIGHVTAAAGFAAEVFPTRVRGTGANIVAGMEWAGFFFAALFGPRMFAGLGYSTTLVIWLVLCPLVAAACALAMKRVHPQASLEEISV